MDEKEILTNTEEKSFIFSSLHKILLVILVIAIALFIGKILFGTRSYEVLQKLEHQEQKLKSDIRHKKKENEKLQKELFEYELATPDISETDI